MQMNNRARTLRALLRGLARVQRTFTIEIGPLRASGVPAVLLGVTGIVLAAGVTAALAKGADRLPETLGQARSLADALNAGRSPRLKS
jgi:predicted membrane protein